MCGIVVNGEVKVGCEFMVCFLVLEIVLVFGVGYDGVDVLVVCECGIYVIYMFDVFIEDVVDMVIVLMLVVVCNVVWVDCFVCSGEWKKGFFFFIIKVSGVCLGIVGLGCIG